MMRSMMGIARQFGCVGGANSTAQDAVRNFLKIVSTCRAIDSRYLPGDHHCYITDTSMPFRLDYLSEAVKQTVTSPSDRCRLKESFKSTHYQEHIVLCHRSYLTGQFW